jgi:LemA protein
MATTASAMPSPRRDSAALLFALIALAGVALLIVGWTLSAYNRLVSADQEVRARWTQLLSAHERRAELVPGLVETIRDTAGFGDEAFVDVAQARAQVGQISREALQDALEDRETFLRYQTAQENLDVSLERLRASTQAHPELKSSVKLGELEAELDGAEHRVGVERLRFNEAARAYNSLSSSFPTSLVARGFDERFAAKPSFEAVPQPQRAPARF